MGQQKWQCFPPWQQYVPYVHNPTLVQQRRTAVAWDWVEQWQKSWVKPLKGRPSRHWGLDAAEAVALTQLLHCHFTGGTKTSEGDDDANKSSSSRYNVSLFMGFYRGLVRIWERRCEYRYFRKDPEGRDHQHGDTENALIQGYFGQLPNMDKISRLFNTRGEDHNYEKVPLIDCFVAGLAEGTQNDALVTLLDGLPAAGERFQQRWMVKLLKGMHEQNNAQGLEVLARTCRLMEDSLGGYTALCVACVTGHLPLARYVLEACDLEARARAPWVATIGKFPGLVQLFLEHKITLTYESITKHPCRFASLQLMVAAGIKPDQSSGENALEFASPESDLSVFQFLIDELGGSVNPTKGGTAPLLKFCMCNEENTIRAIRFLVEAGADPLAVDDSGRGALHYAVMQNPNRAVLEFLVDELGVPLPTQPEYAVEESKSEKEVVEQSRDDEEEEHEDDSPTHCLYHSALQRPHADNIEFLLDRKVSFPDDIFMDLAAVEDANQEELEKIAWIFYNQGANIDASRQNTALETAFNKNNTVVAQVLMNVLAKPTGYEGRGKCCARELESRYSRDFGGWEGDLHQAVFDGKLRFLQKLMKENPKGNINFMYPDRTYISYERDPLNEYISALHVACQQQHLEVVRLLLDSGADLELTTSSGGETALHIAARLGNLEIVELLISRGASLETRAGCTPLDATSTAPSGKVNAAARVTVAHLKGKGASDWSGLMQQVENNKVSAKKCTTYGFSTIYYEDEVERFPAKQRRRYYDDVEGDNDDDWGEDEEEEEEEEEWAFNYPDEEEEEEEY